MNRKRHVHMYQIHVFVHELSHKTENFSVS